jgi:hypothetical protein
VYEGEWLEPRYGFVMDEESNAQKRKLEQQARAMQEERLARTSEEPDEAAQHERRADKASYLRKKLEEQETSEHRLPD